MSSSQNRSTAVALFAVLTVAIVAYSLVIITEPLLGVFAAGTLWLVYLFWRFVEILGRIATALEARVEQEVPDESR